MLRVKAVTPPKLCAAGCCQNARAVPFPANRDLFMSLHTINACTNFKKTTEFLQSTAITDRACPPLWVQVGVMTYVHTSGLEMSRRLIKGNGKKGVLTNVCDDKMLHGNYDQVRDRSSRGKHDSDAPSMPHAGASTTVTHRP